MLGVYLLWSDVFNVDMLNVEYVVIPAGRVQILH